MATFLGNKHYTHEPIWHVQIVMVLAIVLQLLLPDKYVLGSRFLLVAIETALMLALSITTPKGKSFESKTRRLNVFALIALMVTANVYALSGIANRLLAPGHVKNGKDLIIVSLNIYLTNIIVFGLLYWEMDGGGPGRRAIIDKHDQDFLYPQQNNEDYKHPDWRPTFVDYLYVSSTNAMAFSPTDAMPLTRRAKSLMLVQATISLVTIALVAARAVNILS